MAEAVQAWISQYDASYECAHGRLPHDSHKTPGCGTEECKDYWVGIDPKRRNGRAG